MTWLMDLVVGLKEILFAVAVLGVGLISLRMTRLSKRAKQDRAERDQALKTIENVVTIQEELKKAPTEKEDALEYLRDRSD